MSYQTVKLTQGDYGVLDHNTQEICFYGTEAECNRFTNDGRDEYSYYFGEEEEDF